MQTPHTASFDVFDTCLTRTYAKPADLFYDLGEELRQQGLISVSPILFHRWRRLAERRARWFALGRESTLDRIYAHLGAIAGWSQEQEAIAQGVELLLETKCTVAVPAMRQRVRAERSGGAKVFFLSDMYLPTQFIRGLLSANGFCEPGDAIFVSGDIGGSKKSGQLYELVRERLGLDPRRWTHVGDDVKADVEAPRRLGITAETYTEAKFTRYELWRSRNKSPTDTALRSLSGIMRECRLAEDHLPFRLRQLWFAGADVVGPLLFGFVYWCLEEAEKTGIRTLYFIARDGQILHRIAQRIVEHWGIRIECRYLYGSRQAWHPASIVHPDVRDLKWALHRSGRVSLEDVLSRLDVSAVGRQAELATLGFSEADLARPLSRREILRLADSLMHGWLKTATEAAAGKKRTRVLAYFQQEGIVEGGSWAIVDIGWHGNMQTSLAKILRTVATGPSSGVSGFYFALHEECDRMPGAGTLRSYWEDHGWSGRELRRYNIALFEVFCAADHGSVIDFRFRDSRMEPMMVSSKNERAIAWGLGTLHDSVLFFTDSVLRVFDRRQIGHTEIDAIAKRNFALFLDSPTREEAVAFGEFPFSDSQVERSYHPLVPAWTCHQVLQALIRARPSPYGWWKPGSLARQWCFMLAVYLAGHRILLKLIEHFVPRWLYIRAVRVLSRAPRGPSARSRRTAESS